LSECRRGTSLASKVRRLFFSRLPSHEESPGTERASGASQCVDGCNSELYSIDAPSIRTEDIAIVEDHVNVLGDDFMGQNQQEFLMDLFSPDILTYYGNFPKTFFLRNRNGRCSISTTIGRNSYSANPTSGFAKQIPVNEWGAGYFPKNH
jgi:hypothetical protein